MSKMIVISNLVTHFMEGFKIRFLKSIHGVTQSGPEALRSKLDTITTMRATCRSSVEKWFKKGRRLNEMSFLSVVGGLNFELLFF